MARHLPEDPSQFMDEMPSSDPLGGKAGGVIPIDVPLETPVPQPDIAEPPVSPDDMPAKASPFANLDDDEQNSFDEEAVMEMDHMMRVTGSAS